MRSRTKDMESQLRERRPDILGITVAWHGDGGFTQAVYFKSEAAGYAEPARWLLGLSSRAEFDGLPPVPAGQHLASRALPDSGYYLLQCGRRDGKTRPSEFATGTANGGEYLIVLQRQK